MPVSLRPPIEVGLAPSTPHAPLGTQVGRNLRRVVALATRVAASIIELVADSPAD